jgi:hypothetical protein
MTHDSVEKSPQPYARTAGWLYLGVIVGAIFAEAFVRQKLIVSGNATQTAQNIIAHASLFRLGFVGDLLALVCDIALAVLLYVLLRPINKTLSLLAAVFELAGDAIGGVISLGHLAAGLVLGSTKYLSVLPTEQLHAMALLSLDLHEYGYDLELVPIAFRDMLLGYLIFKSGYLPRIIGVLLPIAGLNFLANSVADFLGVEYSVPGSFFPGLIAEGLLCLWLIVMGVNLPKWEKACKSVPSQ